jgi:hypothetical protein
MTVQRILRPASLEIPRRVDRRVRSRRRDLEGRVGRGQVVVGVRRRREVEGVEVVVGPKVES